MAQWQFTDKIKKIFEPWFNSGQQRSLEEFRDGIKVVTDDLQNQVDTVSGGLAGHLADPTDAHDASAISNVPAGTIISVDVQAAINELDTDIQGHITDSLGAHAASAVSYTPTGGLAATELQGAVDELESEKVAFTRLDDSDGSTLVGFIQSGAGAVARTVQAELRDTVNVKQFGAAGDGVIAADGTISGTDDTAAIQAAFDAASATGKAVYVPTGNYVTSAQIDCDAGIQVYGDGVFIETGNTNNDPDGGTWFLLNHTGVGFYCRDDAAVGTAKLFTRFEGLGTYREQPAPAGSWAPTVMSADFRVEFRVQLNDVTLLNPYLGVLVRSSGVLWVDKLRGQPLFTGIECERSSDVQNWNDIHFWPFWSQDSNVHAYTLVNTVGVRVRRSDGLRIKNIFSYAYAWTIDAQDVTGDLSGLAGFSFDHVYADKAGGAVRITSDFYAAYGTMNDVLCNSDSAVGGSGPGIEIAGSVASQINILGYSVTRAHEEALKVHEAPHVVICQPFRIQDWSRSAGTHFAFTADTSATIKLLSIPAYSATPTELYSQATSGVVLLPSGRMETTLTVATGAVTVANGGGVYFIETEAAAATDDLNTINGGYAGDRIILKSVNSGRDTTVKDATGNIFTAGDFILANNTQTIELVNIAGTQWYEVSRSAN